FAFRVITPYNSARNVQQPPGDQLQVRLPTGQELGRKWEGRGDERALTWQPSIYVATATGSSSTSVANGSSTPSRRTPRRKPSSSRLCWSEILNCSIKGLWFFPTVPTWGSSSSAAAR